MQRLLITGVSGFLGYNLSQIAQHRSELIGIYHTHEPIDFPGEMGQLDLTDPISTKTLLDRLRPDAVFHLAAQANANQCEIEAEKSAKINVGTTATLAEWCATNDRKLVFASTDLVFDGQNPPYCETDPPKPTNTYGRQKAAAEQLVLQASEKNCVCRLPLMFGYAPGPNTSFLGKFLADMRQGKGVNFFTDEYRTALDAKSVSKGLLLAMEHGHGIWHLGGNEVLSRYEFGLLIAKVFEIDQGLLIPTLQKELTFTAHRPQNTSMTSELARSYGFDPISNLEALKELKANYA